MIHNDSLKNYTILARFWRFPCNFPTTRTRNHDKRGTRFLTCAGVICSAKRKRWYCAISELIWHLNLALRCTSAPRLLTEKPPQKRSLRDRETAWPGEISLLKIRFQNLWKEKSSFFDLCWGDLQYQTKEMILCNFGAHFDKLGFEVHLHFWPKSLPKNAPFGSRKQHGLASSRTRFLTCAEATPGVKKVRSNPL